MTEDLLDQKADKAALAAIQSALRGVSAVLPHLSGLAAMVRPDSDRRVPTAAIFASGRLLVNPEWFLELSIADRIFVAAHELMHIALHSHERAKGSQGIYFNIAHDFIINDMLVSELKCAVPAGGLKMEGARKFAAERIVNELRIKGGSLPSCAWLDTPNGALAEALAKAGLVNNSVRHDVSTSELDVLSEVVERRWFPTENISRIVELSEKVFNAGDQALALGALREHMSDIFRTYASHSMEFHSQALKSRLRPPWELAVQKWIADVAPISRSYARPSRRQGTRVDIALPGRLREGWTLCLVLDTSGSMVHEIPRLLGLIQSFCNAAGVGAVRILQCDTDVNVDETIPSSDLENFLVRGGGGSDLSPALQRLAADPHIEAAIVITDGYIAYPSHPMPYSVLWAITEAVSSHFCPRYGLIVPLDH